MGAGRGGGGVSVLGQGERSWWGETEDAGLCLVQSEITGCRGELGTPEEQGSKV